MLTNLDLKMLFMSHHFNNRSKMIDDDDDDDDDNDRDYTNLHLWHDT